ncbi:hypothetical protein L198_04535 [Cryptococcus wingfieldii CBS 7118]|uniref:Uncharacterized protein n=1 Tax=Cryptococcus wingfieldii CBS 7118 TaxID=1295528 RepID=A0A1E3J740_9TREE|nr:hypothetical protein L198_04535 [Cryptococcus wingfieldii CBS 7118]ODN95916.1 hypothetical protein L198_04535 [Cryptococcus wingfieldii CBS 7118]
MPKSAPSKSHGALQTRVNKGGSPPKTPPTNTARSAPSKSLLTGKPYSAPQTKADKRERPPKPSPTNTLALRSHPEGDVPHSSELSPPPPPPSSPPPAPKRDPEDLYEEATEVDTPPSLTAESSKGTSNSQKKKKEKQESKRRRLSKEATLIFSSQVFQPSPGGGDSEVTLDDKSFPAGQTSEKTVNGSSVLVDRSSSSTIAVISRKPSQGLFSSSIPAPLPPSPLPRQTFDEATEIGTPPSHDAHLLHPLLDGRPSARLSPPHLPTKSARSLIPRSRTCFKFGIPTNLEECRKAWDSLWDEDVWSGRSLKTLSSARHRVLLLKVEKKQKGAVKELGRFKVHRARLHRWLISVCRPFWTVLSGGIHSLMEPGDIGFNSVFAKAIWGNKSTELYQYLRKINSYRSDIEYISFKIHWTILKLQTRDLGWDFSTGQPKDAFKDRCLVNLLSNKKLKKLLENIIHQGACLLFYSGWSQKACLEEGAVRFKQKAVHDYLRDAFLEEGIWEQTRVDVFERQWADPERKEKVTPLLQNTNKKDPSLEQELARAIIERYKEAREVGEDVSIEKVDPGDKIHARGGRVLHPFAPAYDRFDRQNNEVDPAAAEFFKFDRNLRRHARSEGNSFMESRLPPVAEGSSQFGGRDWHHVHGVKMVTAGLVVNLPDLIETIDNAFYGLMLPKLQEARLTIPNLRQRLLSIAISLSPSDLPTKSLSVPPGIVARSGLEGISSEFLYLVPTESQKKAMVLQVATEIREVEEVEATFESKKAGFPTEADAFERNRRDLTPVDLEAGFEAAEKLFKRDCTARSGEVKKDAELVLTFLDDLYVHPSLQAPQPQASFSLSQVSSVVCRLFMRVAHHFSSRNEQIAMDFLELAFDVLFLGIHMRTPVFGGAWLDLRIAQIGDKVWDAKGVRELPAVIARLVVDLVAVDINLSVLCARHWRVGGDPTVRLSWRSVLGDDAKNLPAIHAKFIHHLIQDQDRICGIGHCYELLTDDPRQRLIIKGQSNPSRKSFVSVQQHVPRSNVDLGDGKPSFPSFDCAWVIGCSPYSQSVTICVSRYVQIIHTTQRKAGGKGHEGALVRSSRRFNINMTSASEAQDRKVELVDDEDEDQVLRPGVAEGDEDEYWEAEGRGRRSMDDLEERVVVEGSSKDHQVSSLVPGSELRRQGKPEKSKRKAAPEFSTETTKPKKSRKGKEKAE